jgi:hypothetical protein
MPSEATDPSAASWSIDNLATSPTASGGEQIRLLDRPRPKAGQSKQSPLFSATTRFKKSCGKGAADVDTAALRIKEMNISSLSGVRSR